MSKMKSERFYKRRLLPGNSPLRNHGPPLQSRYRTAQTQTKSKPRREEMRIILRSFSFQMFNQFQHVAATLRRNLFRSVVGSAVLQLVALFEQPAQPLTRIAV